MKKMMFFLAAMTVMAMYEPIVGQRGIGLAVKKIDRITRIKVKVSSPYSVRGFNTGMPQIRPVVTRPLVFPVLDTSSHHLKQMHVLPSTLGVRRWSSDGLLSPAKSRIAMEGGFDTLSRLQNREAIIVQENDEKYNCLKSKY